MQFTRRAWCSNSPLVSLEVDQTTLTGSLAFLVCTSNIYVVCCLLNTFPVCSLALMMSCEVRVMSLPTLSKFQWKVQSVETFIWVSQVTNCFLSFCIKDLFTSLSLFFLMTTTVVNHHHHVRNDDVRWRTEQPHLSATVQAQKLSLFGHIALMSVVVNARNEWMNELVDQQ